jgi:hypothetical protein
MEQLTGAAQTTARHRHERQLSQRVHKPRVLRTQRVQLVQSTHHRAVALARLQLTQPREHVLAVEAAAPDLRDAREEHEARLACDHAAHEALVQQRHLDALGRETMDLQIERHASKPCGLTLLGAPFHRLAFGGRMSHWQRGCMYLVDGQLAEHAQ